MVLTLKKARPHTDFRVYVPFILRVSLIFGIFLLSVWFAYLDSLSQLGGI